MHMKSILAKLGANDRTHAVAIAVTLGMLRLELASGCSMCGSDGRRSTANA